jgi:predicted dehydrogenase
MNNNRRDFIKMTSLAGLSLPAANALYAQGLAGEKDFNALPGRIEAYQKTHRQGFNMSGYAAPAIDTVRVGIIGLGNRGPTYIKTMGPLKGVQIKALAELRPEKARQAEKMARDYGHSPNIYTGDENAWMKLCERDDIDLVVVTTHYPAHAKMGVYAMKQGKHTAIAVPVAATLEECWDLVKTAEATRKHCMMLENCSYHTFQMTTLNMARKGFYGELVHGECAYNSSKMRNNFSKSMYWDMWWLKEYASKKGNIYPTHGLGPICQMMDINRGDQFDFLVSVESKDFMMADKAVELSEQDPFYDEFVGRDYRGNMNSTIIKTKKGRTILLQHDASTPSPETYIMGAYGTKGASLKYPSPPRICTGNHRWASQDIYDKVMEQYTPKIIKTFNDMANKLGGHGGSDAYKSWRLIDCLRGGFPLDIDVYDSVTWSGILPLSAWSVCHDSNSIKIPDFTVGAWTQNERNMDIELQYYANTVLK